ncbi:hypothetical protein AB0K12_47820 [Nonomuraea sp. NPDC049419]|uniref:hypothetical protein n=1 Tax=Nonomuraea sp. NPDC049419 TaxID=3155772 RepID=UPI00342A9984
MYGDAKPLLRREWRLQEPSQSDVVRHKAYRAQIQLVVCEHLKSVGKRVTFCDYQVSWTIGTPSPEAIRPFSIPAVDAKYTYTVHEARTGRLVKTFRLPGKEIRCPQSLRDDERNAVAPLRPDEDELDRRLRPLIEDPR